MNLKITIKVKDKIEAYDIVTRLGFRHEVVEAEFNKKIEVFDKKNKPAYFMKNKKKNIAKYRSYEFRQQAKTK